jgi:hypothetical protein
MAASSSGAISTPPGVEASGDFGNLFVEQFRQPDREVEEARTRLRADPQQIAEAFGHQQEDTGALALQQRVGRHGRAHLDAFDRGVVAAPQAAIPSTAASA